MAQNSARNAVRKAEGEQELQCWERLYETVTVLQTADISALDQGYLIKQAINTSLSNILSIDGNAEHAAMKVAVLEELSQLFQESNFLRNLWTQLLLLSNRRRLTADSYLREIVSLPRLLANVYRLDLPNWLSESHYHRTVTKAALIAAAGTTNDSSTILLESLSRVLASFPSRMLIHLLDLLAKGLAKNVCDNHITLTNFTQDADGMNKTQLDKATVQVLCQVQSLDLAEQLLKLITSQNNKVGTVGFSNSSAIEYYQLFEIIVECAWQKNNYDQVVELLFLNHSYDPVVASILSHYCPDACVFHSLDLILTVWTEKHFHTNSKLKRQRYLTAAVLQLLQRLPSNCLYARSTSDVAMNIVVSHGISNYLECNDKELRSFGMRVAEALGRSLQQEVAFNELKEYDNQNPSSNLAALIAYDFCRVKADTANVLLANTNVALTKSRHESTVAADDTFLAEDSDEDSEIEGYRIAEELPAKDKYLETNYLRDCLECRL